MDAAEHVVTGPDLPPAAVLDLLDRLVRQSLVAAERVAGHTRYRMLETLRQYAAGKLELAGDQDAMRAAHAEFYLALGERAETSLRNSAPMRWTQALNEEHANVRAALAWLTTTDGHTDQALRLAGSFGLYWHMAGSARSSRPYYPRRCACRHESAGDGSGGDPLSPGLPR